MRRRNKKENSFPPNPVFMLTCNLFLVVAHVNACLPAPQEAKKDPGSPFGMLQR
jgi:hypothetical protein